jgi:nucleotide-binding universal stress UspA family protein
MRPPSVRPEEGAVPIPGAGDLVDEVVAYLEAQPTAPEGPVGPGRGRPPGRRILVPVSGGKGRETGGAALDVAAELALALDEGVRVLHVRERQACRGVRYYLESREEAVALVDEAVRRVRLQGVPATGVIRKASGLRVAEAILLDAAEAQARTVVIGARPHGLLSALLFGSVSLAVARQASCPVMIVHPHRPAGGRPARLGGPGRPGQRLPAG